MARLQAFASCVSAAGILLTIGLTAPVQADAPRVVVSIKPIHSLVSSVMKGIGKPYLLVKGGASPHSYALRPSEARQLSKAAIIFWVGEGLESFLVKPVATLGKRALIVELHESKGIRLRKNRKGGLWEDHDDDHDHKGHKHKKKSGHNHDHKKHKHKKKSGHQHDHGRKAEKHKDHEHGEHNLHIWLDPGNARAIVQAAAAALSKIDPANAERYRKNAVRTLQRLVALDKEIKTQVDPVRTRQFIVFHDAYQYFEKRYGLAAAGSVTINPERRPGAQRIASLRRRIKRDKVHCVFIEPQFPPKIVRTIVAGTGAKIATLDPIGAKLPEGENAYFALLRNLATSLKGCLSK